MPIWVKMQISGRASERTRQREKRPRHPPPSEWPYLLQVPLTFLRLGSRRRLLGPGTIRLGLHFTHSCSAGLRHLSARPTSQRGRWRGRWECRICYKLQASPTLNWQTAGLTLYFTIVVDRTTRHHSFRVSQSKEININCDNVFNTWICMF